ncbi:MAG TPA: SigB/SigF/SigG family RNA polymerase sigma factor [Solirubrobacteraceae bacterium]|nr:SigB/SigF/SigG family RNA polymerase sigma factor [Solirubrobacteraceae bacterium]
MAGVLHQVRSSAGERQRARTRGQQEISARQTRALFARWRSGDIAARDELLESYSPLARNLARRYNNTSEPHEDLSQVAQLGLVKAAERFDPSRGFPFQAFAIPTILGELRRHFRNCSWAVHVPRGVQERALEVRDAERVLGDEYGRAPTVYELAQFVELSTEDVLDAMQALRGYGAISLDAPRGSEPGDEDGSFVEMLGEDDGRFELVELRASLVSALASLEPRQREMLRLRFVEELTQTQIAERIGVSQMQVSRLLRRCLDELRRLTGAVPA